MQLEKVLADIPILSRITLAVQVYNNQANTLLCVSTEVVHGVPGTRSDMWPTWRKMR